MYRDEPVDVVISWVDGNDPNHRKKMNPYLKDSLSEWDDIASPTRFSSIGEIYFCVASILKFAPFVRKIFIVTDNQNPYLEPFIEQYFHDRSTEIIIIDHKEIFAGYEEILPVFNSLSLESCLYRIERLSEDFVYFNDDFFLMRPVKPSDWFNGGKALAYGTWRSVTFDNLLRKIKPRKHGHLPFGFKDSMLNAVPVSGKHSWYFCIEHTPFPLKKSVLKAFFDNHHDVLFKNIDHKFRDPEQFNTQALFYLIGFGEGLCVRAPKGKYLLIKPTGKRVKYIEGKIKYFEKHPEILFGCVESADKADPEVTRRLFGWLNQLMGTAIRK
jgi:hypothetical protein